MDWKEFFKPTNGKVIVFLLLFIILNLLISGVIINSVEKKTSTGLPLPFHMKIEYRGDLYLNMPGHTETRFLYWNLIIDILFFYLVSCSAISVIGKFRK